MTTTSATPTTGWLVSPELLPALCAPGDLLFFDGSGDDDILSLVTHVLPNGIEVITNSDWSHVAMVLDPENLIESTILGDKNGPQVNPILSRIDNYDGPSVWLYKLDPATRAALDLPAVLTYARSRVGKDKYSIRTILHFLLRPVLPFVPHFSRSHRGESVCSEFLAQAFSAGGYPGLKPNETSPGTLETTLGYLEPIQIWKGKE
jgi:hypothetical protein